MNLRIKHVKKALGVIFAMLIIFTIFNFISTEAMLYVGNTIEGNLGLHTNIDVEKVRSFITAISSGILGSAIVAMLFYINEYASEKKDKILKIVRESNKLQKIYREFPFLEHEGDYYRLERNYYFEYLDNKRKKKFNDAIDNLVHTVPKKMKREIREHNKRIIQTESFKYRNELKEILENNPEIRKRRFSDDVIEVEQSLKDILVKYDMYIDRMMETIKKLNRYEYENLELYVEEYKCVLNFTKSKKRKILKYFNPEINEIERIYPYVLNEKVSSEIIANRIYIIHKRFIEKINTHMQNIEDIKRCADRKQAFSLFIQLQKDIYGTDVKKLSEIELHYAYNKLNMCVDNLQWILIGELTNSYKYYSQERYVRKGESVEYGGATKLIDMTGAYMDIYRK